MIKRRNFLAGAAALSAAPGAVHAAVPTDGDWGAWCAAHLQDSGRVVDGPQGHISHSEGQGYGLLLAQAHGDRAAFEAMEAWTRTHLATRQDALMSWKWAPGDDPVWVDWHNATDGDLFRAWALLRAERDSGWQGYRQKAIEIARDIAALCLAADPRAADQPLILPGAEAAGDPAKVIFNPSYVMSRALRELGEAAGEPRLLQAADHGETMLAELAATGLLPNWVDVTPEGYEPPRDHDLKWGYDALRIPLYLCWSGRAAHPAVAVALRLMGTDPDRVTVESTPDGRVLEANDGAGFRAIRSFASCRTVSGAICGDYYADSLLLMAKVAAREAQCEK
ncbi:glycosyl hydrolase family 8 [Falsirhodobacter sp. alg1]|uniref:glycosyl hydrolase family 8 n=1 Tax=Falsirhodobacter sp. alg1 TaxID=1472418 RepID=UPI0009E98A6B|nr:glycosyl hydrolase family 8 [Falsirhodobacter sp. alg1]